MRGRILLPVSLILIFSMSLSASASHLPGDDNDESWHEHTYVGSGPVHFEAGYMSTEGGLVVLTVRDDLWWWAAGQVPNVQQREIGGIICQVPPGADPCPPSPVAFDPSYHVFCHGMALQDGENWDSSLDTYVWVGVDPVGVTLPGFACERDRPPTAGHVSHWPR